MYGTRILGLVYIEQSSLKGRYSCNLLQVCARRAEWNVSVAQERFHVQAENPLNSLDQGEIVTGSSQTKMIVAVVKEG